MHPRSPRTIRSLALITSLLLFASCDGGTDEAVSRRDCARLREHVIDLRMSTVTADQDQHRATLEKVLGDAFLSDCLEQTSSAQLRCALAATDEHALGACSPSP